MIRIVLSLLCVVWGGAALACPGLQPKDKHLFLSAAELAAPKVAKVRAGGTVLLGFCETLPGTGNIPFDPSVSIFYIADRARADLELRTVGACDTVLLIRSPTGKWFFDDDAGGNRNASLRIREPAEGRYEIWVGSQGGYACDTTLVLQAIRTRVRVADGARRIPVNRRM